MKRIKKLLPNKYYLDKNFYRLRDEILEAFKEDQKKFNNDIYSMFGKSEPEIIVNEIITMTLYSIKPKYNLKKKKFY